MKNQTGYFPLKCSSAGPFLLGRTSLQDVHISVDYERRYFYLPQAISANGNPPDIIPTTQPDYYSSDEDASHHSRPLSTGGYAGVGVGIGAAMITIGFLILSRIKRWWPF